MLRKMGTHASAKTSVSEFVHEPSDTLSFQPILKHEIQILNWAILYFGFDCSHEIKRCLLLGRKVMTNQGKHIKKQRHYFANKGPSSQGYGFSSGHVWM